MLVFSIIFFPSPRSSKDESLWLLRWLSTEDLCSLCMEATKFWVTAVFTVESQSLWGRGTTKSNSQLQTVSRREPWKRSIPPKSLSSVCDTLQPRAFGLLWEAELRWRSKCGKHSRCLRVLSSTFGVFVFFLSWVSADLTCVSLWHSTFRRQYSLLRGEPADWKTWYGHCHEEFCFVSERMTRCLLCYPCWLFLSSKNLLMSAALSAEGWTVQYLIRQNQMRFPLANWFWLITQIGIFASAQSSFVDSATIISWQFESGNAEICCHKEFELNDLNLKFLDILTSQAPVSFHQELFCTRGGGCGYALCYSRGKIPNFQQGSWQYEQSLGERLLPFGKKCWIGSIVYPT